MKNHFLYLFVFVLLTFSCVTKAQWSATTALPVGVYANCVAASGNNIYAGTLTQGVFRSTNGGADWVKINNGLTQLQVWSIAIIDNEVYAGSSGGGLVVSTNYGDNWSAANTGIPTTTIIKAIYKSGSRLYIGTSNAGIYSSTNKGGEWIKTNTGISSLIANCFTSVDTNLYVGVGMSRGLYVSGPSSSWLAVNSGLPNNSINALAYLGSSKTLFAGTYGGGVAYSTNNGALWTIANTGLENNYISALTAAGSHIYAGNEYGVYKSTDNGNSWSAFNNGFTGASPVTSLAVNGSTMYCVYKGGIWKSSVAVTSVEIKHSEEGPENFTLSQNFPNPFNPSTTINFNLPQNADVSVVVYNSLGKAVDMLMNSGLTAGPHSVSWNADKFPSGIYYYELRAGNFRMARAMLLIK